MRIASKKTVLLGLVTAALIAPATGAFAETVARVETAFIPQGSMYGTAIAGKTLYVSELDTGLIKAFHTSDEQEATIVAQSLLEPKGMAVASDGTLYIADSGHHRIVRVTPAGEMKTVAGSGEAGYKDGRAAEAQFHDPSDVAIASDGSLYVADTLNHRIRKIATDGAVTTVAGGGTEKDADGWLIGGLHDGTAAEARFNEPSSVAFDPNGNLFIADTGNQRIRELTTTSTVKTVAGGGEERVENRYIKGGYADGQAGDARFYAPTGLTFAPDGGLYIADTLNNAVRLLSSDGTVSTVVGGDLHGYGDGWGVEAQLDGPTDIAVDGKGALWVADRWNRTIRSIDRIALPERTQPADVRFVYNGKALQLKTKAIIRQGATYAPLRELAEALGFTVTYQAASKQVTLTNRSGAKQLDLHAAIVINGSTMVPVRELGNLLGVQVAWSPMYRLVDLTSPLK